MDALPNRSPLDASIVYRRQHREGVSAIESLSHELKGSVANLLDDHVASTPKNVTMTGNVAQASDESPENGMLPIVR
jgi:hypothetical protein